MCDQSTKMKEPCELKEKPHHLDKDQIISYLSLLEKIYDNQSNDKFHQERIFRITKALNSIKKYSNFQVTPFRLIKTEFPGENKNIKDKVDTVKEKENEKKDIEEIMCLIEKELKLNGIDTNDISNDSIISTNVKSQNSHPTSDNHSSEKDTQKNQKRLSKLFLKIEMKLKTFLQEENSKNSDIINDQEDNEEIRKKSEIDNKKILFSKRLSKLPDVENSFFSDKKKVETLLKKVKKQKRRSMLEFNALHSKNKMFKEHNNPDSNSDDNLFKPEEMPRTELLQVPKKKKIRNNVDNKLISAFSYLKNDAIVEDNMENEEEINFDKIDEKQEEQKEELHNDNNDINSNKNNIPLFFDGNRKSSVKINSTINRNKIDLEELRKEREKEFSLYHNKPCFNIITNNSICDYTLVDNGLSDISSNKDGNTSSINEEEESISLDSCEDEDNKEDTKNKSEIKNNENKINMKMGNNTINKKKRRMSYFNCFYRNSLFSPFSGIQNNPERHNEIIERFSKLNL